MDFNVLNPTQEPSQQNEDCRISGDHEEDTVEIINACNTNNSDIERPLSPVLTNTLNWRHAARGKSRLKLKDRLTQNNLESKEIFSSGISNIEENNLNVCVSPSVADALSTIENSPEDNKLEERMKRCLEKQKHTKIDYNIARHSSKLLSISDHSDSNEIFETVKSPDSNKENNGTFLSNVIITKNKETDFNFKKPVSPISKLKKCSKIESITVDFEPIMNLNIGFKTARGQEIILQERDLEKALKLFDDIVPCKLSAEDKENYFEILAESECFNENDQNSCETNNVTEVLSPKSNELQLHIPDLLTDEKAREECSPDKNALFTQITDTQMCQAAENAECIVEFMNDQWSPTKKSQTQLISENNPTEMYEDCEYTSQEEEEGFFRNLTVCEDGTIATRNQSQLEESKIRDTETLENKSLCDVSSGSSKKLIVSQKSLENVKTVCQDVNICDNIKNSEISDNIAPTKISAVSENWSKQKFQELILKLPIKNSTLTVTNELCKDINIVYEQKFNSDFCGYSWKECLKSWKLSELYKQSCQYIEEDIRNVVFRPIVSIFYHVQASPKYKHKRYKERTYTLPKISNTRGVKIKDKKRLSNEERTNVNRRKKQNQCENNLDLGSSSEYSLKEFNSQKTSSTTDDFLGFEDINLLTDEFSEEKAKTNCEKFEDDKIYNFSFSTEFGKRKERLDEMKIQENIKRTRREDLNIDSTSQPKNISGESNKSCKIVNISEEFPGKEKYLFHDHVTENVLNKNTEPFQTLTTEAIENNFGTVQEEPIKRAENLCQQVETTNNIIPERSQISKNTKVTKTENSFGFATASGKIIDVREDSLQRAKNLFQEVETTDNTIPERIKFFKNASISKTGIPVGFATASGKIINVREDSLKNAKNLIQEVEATDNIIPENVQISKNATISKTEHSFGFATASGKKVAVREESLKRAKSLFQDVEATDIIPEIVQISKNAPISKTEHSFEFATASGKKVAVREESLKRAKSLFQDVEATDNIIPEIAQISKNATSSKTEHSFGFATASEKKVAVREESLKRAKSLFQDVEATDNIIPEIVQVSKNAKISKTEQSFGFATASGKKVAVREESLKRAKSLFQDVEATDNIIPDIVQISKNATISKTEQSFGFATASGKKVAVREESLKKAKSLFQEVEATDNIFSRNNEASKNVESVLSTFSEDNTTESKFDQKSPVIALNKSFSSPQISINDSPVLRNRTLSINKKRSLGVTSCPQINITENNLKRAKLVFDEVKTPSKKEITKNDNHLPNYISSVNKTNIPLHVTTRSVSIMSPQNKHLPSTSSVSSENKSLLNSTESNLAIPKISSIRNIYLEKEPEDDNSCFVFKEKTPGGEKTWEIDIEKELESIKLKMSVLQTRKLMLKRQQTMIESGSSDHRRQRPGHLVIRKSKRDNRISLKEAVNNRRPEKNTYQNCLKMGLNSSLLDITAHNSSTLHIHVPWCTCPPVIETEDGAVVVPNQHNYIGIAEIERGFLAMPTVDPSLVPKNWVSNHYRWIVWKLASMERNYPDVFKDVLSVENVMSQLKYRYDREIDKAERPALRKIVECDDSAAKRMVLCVAAIIKLPEAKYELDLTDGWYSIKTVIDTPLTYLVEKNIIREGCKLMTQGTKLLNCEGCSPLELPANVRLQIYCNSTRRAAWDVKLGYQPNPGPLRIGLRTVVGNGGPVGAVSAYVVRLYPLSFMERCKESTIWRNQRAELRCENQWETTYSKIIEDLQQRVQLELERERTERENEEKRKSPRNVDIRDVECGEELYRLINDSIDSDNIREILTSTQLSALQDYMSKINMNRQAELTSRIQEKLASKNIQLRRVSKVLKLLLVDVHSPSHHCMLSVWQPNETHTQLLKEGIVINIYNVTAKNKGTLSSTPRTQFVVDSDFDKTKFENLNRIIIPISQTTDSDFKPLFAEYDTVGIVVTVDVQKLPQTLWLVDENKRFLLIRIREGNETCCVFDGMTPGKVIAVMNIKHQNPFKIYGEAVGNHYTKLSSYPQQEYLRNFMKDFITNLPEDIEGYLTTCQNLVEDFSSHFECLNPLPVINTNEEYEAFAKKICGIENTKESKSEPLTLSDEEMALIDTQAL